MSRKNIATTSIGSVIDVNVCTHCDTFGFELRSRQGDTWLAIFADALVSTLLIFIATAVCDLIVSFVFEPLGAPRNATIYLPLWTLLNVPVLGYARWRNRIRYTKVDVIWVVPVVMTLAIMIDLVGAGSVLVFLAAWAMHFLTSWIRVLFARTGT